MFYSFNDFLYLLIAHLFKRILKKINHILEDGYNLKALNHM
jgi:hypothetical protein